MMFASTRLLHRWSWWRHHLVVQKNLALFWIIPIGTMDLAPLLCVCRATEQFPLLLLYGLLLTVPAISVISAIPTISMIGHVDFLIVLLLL
jgi:hypothetical protein